MHDPHNKPDRGHRRLGGQCPKWLRTWTFTWSILTGVLALIWLLLRSGSKPSRFVYPCQQAAFSTAALAFGAPVVAGLISARRQLAAALRRPAGMVVAGCGLVVTVGLWGYFSRADVYRGPLLDPPPDYQAQVFHVTECPQEPVGSRFVGVDRMIALMGREGVLFYRSDTVAPDAGPDGLFAADDVIVIKINYQWTERGGTNVDVLRGVIHRLVAHPDTFTGEVVVCENAQFNPVNNFDRPNNNAQDITLSPHDVVMEYQALGYDVSHYDWTARRYTEVNEYNQGDMNDGYIVGAYDAELQGRVSYPKFQTAYGARISLKYGLWDPGSETYDRQSLKFINMPVLKSHHSTYGATVCVKNYMGVVTGVLSTNSHSAIRWGLLGALQADIQPATLNILDCIWINGNPYSGPGTTYAGATRRDMLVAGTDPVAVDIWSVKNILIPAFIQNGYSPPWPEPSADPDDPTSDFRQYLDNSMNRILPRYDVTNDLTQINTYSWNGAGDFDEDGDVDADDYDQFEWCYTGPDGGPIDPQCQLGDFDEDGDIDCDDWNQFLQVWTQLGSPPSLPQCGCPADIDVDGAVNAADLALMLGAWGPCADCVADLDDNGQVNAADLALLLGQWGACGL